MCRGLDGLSKGSNTGRVDVNKLSRAGEGQRGAMEDAEETSRILVMEQPFDVIWKWDRRG